QMLLQIKDAAAADRAQRAIQRLLAKHQEWFLSQDERPPLALNTHEFDFSTAQDRLILTSWTEAGSRTWRVTAWNWTGEKLELQASRRMGAEKCSLEFVPRASAKALVLGIAAARQARCENLARLLAESLVEITSAAEISVSGTSVESLITKDRQGLKP